MVTPLLLTAAEAAEALRCTPAQFDQLVADGRLTPVKLFPDSEDMFGPEALADLVDQMAGGGPEADEGSGPAGTPAATMNEMIRRRAGR